MAKNTNKCCGPATKVCGNVGVTNDPTNPLTVDFERPVEVTGAVGVNGEVTVDGCVQVENKEGGSLNVTVDDGRVEVYTRDEPLCIAGCVGICETVDVEGCVTVSNCECDPLYVTGQVSVDGPVTVEGPVTVDVEGTVTVDVEGTVDVVVDNEVDVKVNDVVCALTEENLHKGVIKNLYGETGVDGNTGAVVVDIDTSLNNEDFTCDAFYPKTLTICALTERGGLTNNSNMIRDLVLYVDGVPVLDMGILSQTSGVLSFIQLGLTDMYRLVIDLEEFFGSVKLDSSPFPLANGSQVSLSFTSPDGEFQSLSLAISGSVRCPQIKSCNFSVPQPGCTGGEIATCSDRLLDFDLENLVTNLEEFPEGDLEYCWRAISVDAGVLGASETTQEGQFVDDFLVNETSTTAEVVYEFTVKSADGLCNCKDELVVLILPPVVIGEINGLQDACCDETFTVNADGVTGGCGGPYTYQWYLDDTPLGTEESQEISYDCEECISGPVEHEIRLVVSDTSEGCLELGCTGGITGASTEYCRPTVDIKYVVCVDQDGTFQEATLTACPTGGVHDYTYLWSPSGETGAEVTVETIGEYCVVVTDSSPMGCTGSDCVVVEGCP